MMSYEELAAKLEIQEQLARYCRGVDRLDDDLTLGCFMTNATLHYADVFAGTPAEFVRWLWPIHRAMAGHAHRVTNVLVDLLSPSAAVSESCVFVTLRIAADERLVDVINHGRYLDRWLVADGAWRIAERTYVSGLRSTVPAVGIDMAGRVAAADAPRAPVATRGGDDPSYALSAFGAPSAGVAVPHDAPSAR
jgi:hypothetical protein